jgi:hypothetical protein
MADLLIIISSDLYVRNYLQTDALDKLREEHRCYFIADEALSLAAEVSDLPNFLGFFRVDEAMAEKHQLLFNLLMWRNRKKSRTFLYRWMRNARWNLVDQSHGSLQKLFSIAKWSLGAVRNPLGLRIPLLGSRVIFPFASFLIKRQLVINPSLAKFFQARRYDAVVFPSAAADSVSVDATRLGHRTKTTTICLIDNWDNLSSKTVFWTKPDYLGVWGKQSQEQAIDIHGFDKDQVQAIGTPRFETYFNLRERATKNIVYDFPYILFVGAAMPFDEISALKKIESLLMSSDRAGRDLRVIYRPHPWRQKRRTPSSFEPESFSIISLDTQIANAFAQGLTPDAAGTAFQPDLNYYPSLLAGAECVVGPLTTMLLEAAVCLRPVVALNYSDGHHSNTSLQYFSHFDGADRIPNFRFCNEAGELEDAILGALDAEPPSPLHSDTRTDYFIHHPRDGYPKKLSKFVSTIVKS